MSAIRAKRAVPVPVDSPTEVEAAAVKAGRSDVLDSRGYRHTSSHRRGWVYARPVIHD